MGGRIVGRHFGDLRKDADRARAIAFGKRRIRELLQAHAHGTPAEVNRAMRAALRAWQGTQHRRDDLTFFCFRT